MAAIGYIARIHADSILGRLPAADGNDSAMRALVLEACAKLCEVQARLDRAEVTASRLEYLARRLVDDGDCPADVGKIVDEIRREVAKETGERE